MLVFRSPAVVAVATVMIGTAAHFLTKSAVGALETSMRYNLALLSAEVGSLYKEVI
jgi:hypothetical protein